jgi:methionyl-tRNA synthetase
VFGHGWWIAEGQKMSKTLGNFIDLDRLKAYAAKYSLDGLRWYLATQGPLSGTDADFSHAKFIEVYNAELANGIGNCASRVSNMIGKYFEGRLPDPAPAGAAAPPAGPGGQSYNLPSLAPAAAAAAAKAADAFDLAGALHQGVALIRAVDGYINATEPFKLAKRLDAEPALRPQLAAILYNCAEAIRTASLILSPAMPFKMADLWQRWNCPPAADTPLAELARWGGLKPGTPIEKGEALFMRADPAEPPPGAGT